MMLARRPSWLLWSLLLLAALSAGCQRRTFYRGQADAEVNRLVAGSIDDPRYALAGIRPTMDPRSRFHDVTNPDAPPMPSDDPEAHKYMHFVNGMRGFDGWESNGVVQQLENPCWRERLSEYVPVNERGEVVLDIDSSLRLAYMHSPTWQDQIETLYLSALDVSAERFRFQTQFFGGNGDTFRHTGALAPGGEANTLTNSLSARATQRLATGGELLVGFANSFVWQFAGNDQQSTVSILNFNLVQPLLRTGGRVVAMEQLTIVERSLLANIRALHRYRQGLYTSVAIGSLGVSGPQRRGGFFGGTGLTGFTGQGAGGLGGVGGATGFGRGGFATGGGGGGGAGGLAGGGAGTVGGFVGLLQTLQEYRNAEDSFELQKRSLAELEANLAGDKIDLVQVDQFRQSIETQRAQLLQSGINLENSIESYLTGTLGLPPDLPVALDDAFIRPFQLVTPGITRIQARFNLIQDEIGALPTTVTPEQLAPILDALDAGRLELEAYLKVVEEDFATLESKLPERTARMTPAEINALQNDLGKVGDKFDELVGLIAAAPPRLAAIRQELGSRPVDDSLSETLTWMRDFQQLVQQVSLLQARVRLEAVTIDPLELDPVTALTIARANRPDLMNNRANLVDSWRLIAFNANALLSDLDVTFSGDLSSVGQNPAQFRGPTGHLSAGLQLDGPFTRLLERNNYRQSLIDYQQSRRQYIQFEDSLNLSTRQTLRQLEQLRTNLEIQRRAVTISIQRVDLTQSDLNRPIAPDEPRGDTVVQNLLSALNDLRNTQNNFMSVWLNYYATRMVLMRDLGVMELDDEGRWIDRPIDWSAWMPIEAIEMPPAIPREWMEQAFPEGIPPLAPTDESEQGEPAELIEPSQSYRPQLERLADRREPLYRPLPVEPTAPRTANQPQRTERRR